MPPFQKLRSFNKHKDFASDDCEASNISNRAITAVNRSEKVQKALKLSKSAPQSTVVQCVPKSMVQFPSNLTELELSNQNFTDLPDLFKSVGNLKKLYIHDTLLNDLPDSVGELMNLRDLNLSRNELKELPESISNLKHLEKLNVCHNQLEKLPLSYAKLQLLRELDLSNNKFQRLPKCIANGMGTLKILNISDNPHVRVNVIPSSKYLEKFIARNNGSCGTFPDWILCSKFFNMKEFDFYNTQFEIYTFNGKDGNLYYTKMSMNSSNLSSSLLDMIIDHMVRLQIVDVGNKDVLESQTGNIFNYIPVQKFRSPKLITELNFRGTGLATVPATINELCNLKRLDLGLNNISWFPDQFCELQKLEYLKIDGNSLILFPNDIGNLTSIQEIHSENNSVQSLPESFQNLKSLRLIDLYNNKFREMPEALCILENLKGLDLELNYFATTDIKFGNTNYSALREHCKKEKHTNFRITGVKEKELSDSDSSGFESKDMLTDTSGDENDQNYRSFNSPEENWDTISETDDEYEPNSSEINYNERSKEYLRANFAPLGFCPADLHSRPVKEEVASMRAYGSYMLPDKIVEGQFDDA